MQNFEDFNKCYFNTKINRHLYHLNVWNRPMFGITLNTKLGVGLFWALLVCKLTAPKLLEGRWCQVDLLWGVTPAHPNCNTANIFWQIQLTNYFNKLLGDAVERVPCRSASRCNTTSLSSSVTQQTHFGKFTLPMISTGLYVIQFNCFLDKRGKYESFSFDCTLYEQDWS